MMDSNKSFFGSFRRAFGSSTRTKKKSPVFKRKESSGHSFPVGRMVFPEDNDTRYEGTSDFTLKHNYDQQRTKQKKTRKPMHSLSEIRRERPSPPVIRRSVPTSTHQSLSTGNLMMKSATLPQKPSAIPAAHRIAIPPPKHSKRKLPTSPPATVHPLFPPSRPLPHTMSTVDFSTSQYKAPVNITKAGPNALPQDYSEPFHWLNIENPYSTISPRTEHQSCKNEHTSSNDEQHKYANIQVSASMMELRSNNDYMEIDVTTLNRPTVASDYQQPIALRRLPGPPSAVKERRQRREEKKLVRGTIVVLDENKTLEV